MCLESLPHAGNNPASANLVSDVLRLNAPIQWWEPILPAQIWLGTAALVLMLVRVLIRSNMRFPRAVKMGMRVSGRLSRAGFNAWRFWGGKWR